MFRPIVALLFAGLTSMATGQMILTVPNAFPTIQSAINAAALGDQVRVFPGTYNETIDFLGKSITVLSVNGADVTTIDAQLNGTVVSFVTGEGSDSVLRGFTLRNGLGADGMSTSPGAGGGIHCDGTSPVIDDCVIEDCTGGNGGLAGDGQTGGKGGAGGIQILGATFPIVTRCTIRTNTGGDGGTGSAETVAFIAGGQGGAGGIGCDESFADVSTCRVLNNTGGRGGDTTSPTMSQAGRGGAGGIQWTGGSPTVRRSDIIANLGGAAGDTDVMGIGGSGGVGGVSARGPLFASGPATMDNCVVAKNIGNLGSPTGMFPGDAATGGLQDLSIPFNVFGIRATHCTIVDNRAAFGSLAGGIEATSFSTLDNSIVRDNIGGNIAGAILVRFCNVGGAFAGPGNFDADPLLADVLNDDYRLLPTSPCIDAGSASVVGLPTVDRFDDPRVLCAAPDVGVHEFDLSGSGGDFILSTTVNGMGVPDACVKRADVGDLVTIIMSSPGASLVGAPLVLGVQGYQFPDDPFSLANFPDVKINGFGAIVLHTGIVLAVGNLLQFQVVPFLSNRVGRLQAFATTDTAPNGFFFASDAHDIAVN